MCIRDSIWANDFYYQLIDWPKDEYEAIFHNRPDLYYEYMDCQEEWQKLGKTVMKALEEHQSGYKMAVSYTHLDVYKRQD